MTFLQKIRSELETPRADRPFGSGWISGSFALLAGIVGLLMVIVLRNPSLTSVPQLGAVHESFLFRLALYFVLISGFVLAALSMVLRRDLTADHFEGKRRTSDWWFWSGGGTGQYQGPPRSGFFRFFKDTALEGEQAEFPVDIKAGILQIDGCFDGFGARPVNGLPLCSRRTVAARRTSILRHPTSSLQCPSFVGQTCSLRRISNPPAEAYRYAAQAD